ncbi:MAG TPA: translational GTPase TypA [Ignavibacteriaceae bacterium]|jgi:GTP-binding protein|nr:MAG: GTP-binding protein TypA/BipA [Ignavibacteria bacterium ADurb.Bin266]HQF42841.1 translational GTPase TypA [Ignavibacteriaceae bacterium]HQI39924.1 translational GTPase TypA [Ignavibacteriaceae bacterium]
MIKKIRNIAIIAHVDHGKTTLVDQILKQCSIFRSNQVVRERFLDSNDLERERGITILAKNISITYKDYKINVIDTPGHADFGGEVERVLKMADGVLLLVDSFEGPMPQTRFVLEKALSLNLKPIVVINKIDRTDNRPAEVLNEIYDLFIELDANDEQLDFPVIYASGRNGWAVRNLNDKREDLTPLLDSIINDVPAPIIKKGSVQLQITTLDYNDYVGRIGIGRVFRGELKSSDKLSIIKRNGNVHPVTINQLLVFEGLKRTEAEEVYCGDICAIVGIDDVDIGDTITASENPEPLPNISIDEPTISMTFTVNNSPFYGREGKSVTSRQLRERLFKELEHNVALKVQETNSPDSFKVSGRGILHLSVLVENMRREGFELQIREPKVIYKEIDGKKAEPIEVLVVDVPEEFSGKVIELVGQRRGELTKMEKKGNMTKIQFHIPSRGIMGLRTKILNATQGEAVMHHRFYQYEFFKGSINGPKNGVIISMDEGSSTAYAIDSLQDRGKFFIDPGDIVYKGQIIGEHSKENDIEVNIQRGKKLTNMRASGADKAIKITPAIKFSLEEALEYVDDDEMVEVTPKSIRLRKLYLDTNERKRFNLGKLNK